jgi:hypothetical protein
MAGRILTGDSDGWRDDSCHGREARPYKLELRANPVDDECNKETFLWH